MHELVKHAKNKVVVCKSVYRYAAPSYFVPASNLCC